MKDEVQIILIITGIASTPLKSETVQEAISRKQGTNQQNVYNEPVVYSAVPAEPEPEPAMAYTAPEPSVYKTNSDRILPSEPADTPSYTPSPAANAAFDTIMQPLIGVEPSSRKVSEKRSTLDTVDLDTPTFLRLRM